MGVVVSWPEWMDEGIVGGLKEKEEEIVSSRNQRIYRVTFVQAKLTTQHSHTKITEGGGRKVRTIKDSRSS